jgi:DMSO/TMAO reductase YedYZ molybdopterin-dependent catalytic subunit
MLLARVLFGTTTLPELIQDRLVLSVPGRLFSFVLDHLLYLGKPLLFFSQLLFLLVLAGLGGLVMRRMRYPMILPAVVWIVTGLVLLPLAGQGVFGGSISVTITTLIASAAYGLGFWFFVGYPWRDLLRAASRPGEVSQPETLHNRRRLLVGGALAVLAAGLGVRAIGKLPPSPSQPQAGGGDAAPTSGGNVEAQAGSPLQADPASPLHLPAAVTPLGRFYVVSKNLVDPEIKSPSWSLRIGGLVSQTITLRYEDFTSMPSIHVPRTLECISNAVGGDLISNGVWTGVRLADVLDRAGVKPQAAALAFTSADGFTADMTIDQGRDPATILAYQLNDAPLPSKHGYPVRVLATGIYGMKNPKWVTQIDAIQGTRPGFWQQQGWDERGIIQTMATITTPVNNAELPMGVPLSIGGVAFAGSRDIRGVEVSVDGGAAWAAAELLPSQGPSTWTFWHFQWQPPKSGQYSIAVRATDGTGTVQPSRRTDPFPDGATGYHVFRYRITG